MGILPDFSAVKSFEDIEYRFKRSAEEIILSHYLTLSTSSWAITALELYLFTDGPVWRDEYTHRHDEQRRSSTWYVHRPHHSLASGKPATSWRPPNRSGIDITCGSADGKYFGGLLIRQLNAEKGSATAFKAIVRAGQDYYFNRKDRWTEPEKDVISLIDGKKICSGLLRLAPLPTRREGQVRLFPRIGLRAKEPDRKSSEGISFRDAPLRAVYSNVPA